MNDYELTQIYHGYVKMLNGLQQHCDSIITEWAKLSSEIFHEKSGYDNALTAIRKWHRDRAKEAEVVSLGVLFQ